MRNPVEMLNTAVQGFPAELGRQVQERRAMTGASVTDLAQMLSTVGVPLSPEDVEQLEAGERPELELRLLAALLFLLEISVDKILIANFQRG